MLRFKARISCSHKSAGRKGGREGGREGGSFSETRTGPMVPGCSYDETRQGSTVKSRKRQSLQATGSLLSSRKINNQEPCRTPDMQNVMVHTIHCFCRESCHAIQCSVPSQDSFQPG